MSVNSTHPDYDANLATWLRVRDVMAGEDTVKSAGERYLPRLESQTDAEYAAYRSRASFFNATARTADGYLGLVFRRPPFVKLPEGANALGKSMEAFVNDADMLGTPIANYAKNVVKEVLTVGRAGTLIDWCASRTGHDENRVYTSMYAAENILNWRMERINGRNLVTETPGATAGFLEYTGQGLSTFERAMDRDERLMAILGARLLENQKRVGETAQTIELRQSGENSILGNVANSVSASLTQVLRWAYWWNSTEDLPDTVTKDHVVIELNTDFSTKGLSAQELNAIVAAWQKGAMSRDSMLELFRRGEVLPEGRTNDEEERLIEAETPKQTIIHGDRVQSGSSVGMAFQVASP